MRQNQTVADCTTGEWLVLRIIGFNRNGSRVFDTKIPDTNDVSTLHE